MLTTLGSTRLATIREASSKSVSRGFEPCERSGRHVDVGLQLVEADLVDELADQVRRRRHHRQKDQHREPRGS